MISMKRHFVYILTNKPRRVLYVGATRNLVQRIHAHQEALVDGFSKKYNLNKLAYYEIHDDTLSALQRERNLKRWLRSWKIELIENENPSWKDLWDDIV